jgi:hypothetical protein
MVEPNQQLDSIEQSVLRDMVERHGTGAVLRYVGDLLAYRASDDPARAAMYVDLVVRLHGLARAFEVLKAEGFGL